MKSLKWNPEKLVTGITFSVLFLLLTAVTVYVIWTAREINAMGWPFIFFLILFAIGLPIFLTFGVFSVYRHSYVNQYPDRLHQVEWNRYIIQMLTLITVLSVIVAALVWRDSEASRYFAEHPSPGQNIKPSLVLGRGSIPLYFSIGRESKPVFFPTAMFWWAYIGSITSIIQMILRRFSIGHLVAKSYLNSALRVILSMIATALIFVAAQVWPESFSQNESNLLDNWHMLMLVAFFAGVFPDSIIRWVTTRIRKWLKLGGSEFLPLTEIQGIDPELVTFLNDEGIWSVVDLATCDQEALAANIHMDRETIEIWQKQARLLAELGDKETVEHFRKLGINDWCDLTILEDISIEKIKLDDLLNAPSDSSKVSPVLIRVLKKKMEG